MCGIVGIVNFENPDPIDPKDLDCMAGVLAHRGPDDSGLYLDTGTPQCGLAHRRLSIIDLAFGTQPMADEDQTLVIVYNGECYNFQALRERLAGLGHRFKTHSDTEVLLHLYQQYGPTCVDHIRGMFAFAIWDTKRRELFLARDRMGKKPLFFTVNRGAFVFASQCKAILQYPGFPRGADTSALVQCLFLQYVSAPRSGFESIFQLPPAHTLLITSQNYQNPIPKRYWRISRENRFSGSFGQAVEHVRSELLESVRLRLISDVPLGAFLSGGLDSSIVVGLMTQASGQPVKTCSIGFSEGLYNELPWARQVVNRFNCNHSEQIVRPDSIETIQKLVEYYDEPFADCSALPTFYLARLARQHVKVALTGDGGDECFGGYDRYRGLRAAEILEKWSIIRWIARRGFWGRIAAGEHRSIGHRLGRFLSALNRPAHQQYLQWLSVFNPDMIREIVGENLPVGIMTPGADWDCLADYFRSDGWRNLTDAGLSDAHYAMLADAELYLPGDLNTKTDRAAMAVGLELRCPFEDHKVVELAYSLPIEWRTSLTTGKIILRQAFRNLLPHSILRRKKLGFGVPVGQWFRGSLRDFFIETVLSLRAMQRGLLRRAAVENLLQQNDSARFDHGHKLWSLLMLELWSRNYLD
jgi:asparagine synthase (glutamine-hydrolysing)